ncbi:MAG: hypothetical protein FJY56_05145 [Betaproteobacteria bacterium]|nr:hypothetical protein [Betaproteobacteria bacterium]
MKRIGLVVLLIAALGGCATYEVASDYRITAQTQEGVVIGSITFDWRYSNYRIHIRQLSGEKERIVSMYTGLPLMFPMTFQGDFDSAPKGTVFAMALPPGDYEVFRWSLISGDVASAVSTAPFSIRFKMERGKAVYLENFHFLATSTIGLTVRGARMVYRDRLGRDIPVFKQKYLNMASIDIAYVAQAGIDEPFLGGPSEGKTHIPIFVVPVLKR